MLQTMFWRKLITEVLRLLFLYVHSVQRASYYELLHAIKIPGALGIESIMSSALFCSSTTPQTALQLKKYL
jgi:hypothetical protein